MALTPLVWSQSVGVFATAVAEVPSVSQHPGRPGPRATGCRARPAGWRSSSRAAGARRATCPPACRRRGCRSPRREDLPVQSGMSLSISTTLMPLSTAFCSSPLTFGLVGVIAIACDALADHGLDGVDLALVVGAALALGVDDGDVGVVGVPLLHRVDHGVVEVDRELRDEADLGGARGRARARPAGCPSRSSRPNTPRSAERLPPPASSRLCAFVSSVLLVDMTRGRMVRGRVVLTRHLRR